MDNSSSDHLSKSCIISAGNGGFIRFFLSEYACFAFFQFKILSELLVAAFERRLFGFRPMCASSGETLVTSCHVILNVLITSATPEASLYGVFVLSIFIIANLRFNVCSILSTTHDAL